MTTIYANGITLGKTEPTIGIDEDKLYELIFDQRASEMPGEMKERKTFGPPEDQVQDVCDLSQTWWGVIWAPGLENLPGGGEAKKQIRRLIDHRNSKITFAPFEFAYQTGMTVRKFLNINEVEPGGIDVTKVPYYLLIVAPPSDLGVSWEFQQELDREYAVGRLWFDEAADWKKYVDALIEYETTKTVPTAREVLLLGSEHPFDTPTELSAAHLVRPLETWMDTPQTSKWNFKHTLLIGDQKNREATRANLLKCIRGQALSGETARSRPALIFTATHGIDNPYPSVLGSLLLNDWTGSPDPAEINQCLFADDEVRALDLRGAIHFCFACFSAGTPKYEDWIHPSKGVPQLLTEQPFVARLPQKLLAGGLLAFIGHVSRAWGLSFAGLEDHNKDRRRNFEETLSILMQGKPAGHALDSFNKRYLVLADDVGKQLEFPKKSAEDKALVVRTWKARNDCRGYVVLGDPYANLRTHLF